MHDTSSNLHLPRILCLHGGGTNATIFKIQCRVLEKRLARSFRLVYAQAPFTTSRPGPDVTSVYKDFAPFRVWLRDHTMPGNWTARGIASKIDASLAKAMAGDEGTGEWVGLMGFSQGAKIAASILYRQQKGGMTDFKFAILVAGRGPLVWLMPERPQPKGLVDAATPFTYDQPEGLTMNSYDHILRLPTLHVHGLSDPGLEKHQDFYYDYCDPRKAELIEWDGNHRMPVKSKDVELFAQHILSIHRDSSSKAKAPRRKSIARVTVREIEVFA